MENNEKSIPDYLKVLIEGCSCYNKLSYSFWIVLAVFSLFALLPVETSQSKIALPFSLGELSKADFYPLAFLVISLLIICFGSAFCQANRISSLIRRAIDKIKDDYIFNDITYLQDIVDSSFYPSLNRVAPLAQSIQGKKQFFPEAYSVSPILKFVSTVYYIVLKIAANLVLFVFPGYALIKSFQESGLNKSIRFLEIPSFFLWIFGIFALIILFQLFVYDLFFIIKVFKRLNFKK